MRFLITGGAGFIGSAYVRGLLTGTLEAEVESVVVLDSLTYAGNLKNLDPISQNINFQFVEGDIRDSSLVQSLVSRSDVVINFAAESHVDRSISDPKSFVDTNILGTSTLVMASIDSKVQKYIQISTDEVYGSIDSGSWDESCALQPNSPYSASKAAADLIVRGLGNTNNLNYNITRCSNNYGPYQYPEKIIPLFVTNLIDEQLIPVYGNGKNMREWIHVDDHCSAINLVLHGGEAQSTYNIGGGEELSNLNLTRDILKKFHLTDAYIEYVQDRKNHDLRYAVDDSKIRKELKYRPKIDFDDGLSETIEWYRKNENWWRPLKVGKVS